jgi:hypothetical protein
MIAFGYVTGSGTSFAPHRTPDSCLPTKHFSFSSVACYLPTWFSLTKLHTSLLTSSIDIMRNPTTRSSLALVSFFSSFFIPFFQTLDSSVIGRDLEYFSQAGFDMDKIYLKRNAPVAQLYEDAIRNEGAIISSSGALINFSGKKTGRSPKDKRIVYEETSKDNIWWGSVNIKMDERM